MLFVGGCWMMGLGLWVPASGVSITFWRHDSAVLIVALAASGGIGALSTVVVGYLLGVRRLWRHLLVSLGAGTIAMLCWYVVAMVAFAPSNDTSSDNAAGAGVVILGIPTLLLIGIFLALGAGAGRLRMRGSRSLT